jgi:amino acid transporter
LTLVFSLVGVGIAAVLARKARRPRATFVRTALTLTALSFVPDLTFGFDAGTAATLIALHIVAAAIVVPTLAGRLAYDPDETAAPAPAATPAADRSPVGRPGHPGRSFDGRTGPTARRLNLAAPSGVATP